MAVHEDDWSRPAAVAIPPEGYFELERGRYGPTYPRTPACHGFSIIAKVKEGPEAADPQGSQGNSGLHHPSRGPLLLPAEAHRAALSDHSRR